MTPLPLLYAADVIVEVGGTRSLIVIAPSSLVIGPNSSAIGSPVTERKKSPPLSRTLDGASELIFSINVNVLSLIDVGAPLDPA